MHGQQNINIYIVAVLQEGDLSNLSQNYCTLILWTEGQGENNMTLFSVRDMNAELLNT